ncbi:hypothetical protein FPOAC2_12297 [Fusarium poae]
MTSTLRFYVVQLSPFSEKSGNNAVNSLLVFSGLLFGLDGPVPLNSISLQRLRPLKHRSSCFCHFGHPAVSLDKMLHIPFVQIFIVHVRNRREVESTLWLNMTM